MKSTVRVQVRDKSWNLHIELRLYYEKQWEKDVLFLTWCIMDMERYYILKNQSESDSPHTAGVTTH